MEGKETKAAEIGKQVTHKLVVVNHPVYISQGKDIYF